MTTTVPIDAAERLTAAEAKREAFAARLEVARRELAELRQAIDKARDAHRDELARVELAGGPAPSRAVLIDLEARQPEADDRVIGLERALSEVEREWRHAKAAALEAEAAAVAAETARRQARIHELQPQIDAMQREISEHGRWIQAEGPVLAMRLEAEATQLRRP